MDDQRFTELLGKRLAGEISSAELDELNFLVANNENYRQEYESIADYFEQPERPDKNIDAVFQNIKKQLIIPGAAPAVSTPLRARKRSVRSWYQIAAVFVLLVGASTFFQLYFNRGVSEHSPLLNLKSFHTAAAERTSITLSDGSTVLLNAASQLKYPVHFKGGTREVYLSGEAFFDVKKDPQHPFVVHTDKIAVKVLGTAFDVKAYKDDAETEATLIRGLIEVTLKKRDAKAVIIRPNEKFTITGTGKTPVISKLTYYTPGDANAILETSWTNNKLLFKNYSFSTLSKLMERWYGVKIIFKNEELKAFRYTGQFTNENITQALDALKMIEAFSYKVEREIVYIYK